MEFFKSPHFDFLGRRVMFFSVSAALILATIGVLIMNRGPVLGIEFTGGTMLQIGFNELPPIDQVRDALNKDGWDGYSLQTQPTAHNIIVRVKTGEKSKEDIAAGLVGSLQKSFPGNVKTVPERIEFVGPVIGKKLILNAFFAIMGSFLVIVIYVAYRFKNWIWGGVGVLALMHDVFITLGLLTFLNREMTLVVVAALLTLAGYSINDTIVIFDRVRENARTSRKESLKDLYNRCLNESLGRTLNTAFCALLSALSLYFWGGEVIHDFALAMTVGIVLGSYSTIFVAIALIHQLETRNKAHA